MSFISQSLNIQELYFSWLQKYPKTFFLLKFIISMMFFLRVIAVNVLLSHLNSNKQEIGKRSSNRKKNIYLIKVIFCIEKLSLFHTKKSKLFSFQPQ